MTCPGPPAFPCPFFLGLQLQTQQSEAQDASCLPALKVSDIEPSMPCTELEVALAGQCCTAAVPSRGRSHCFPRLPALTIPETARSATAGFSLGWVGVSFAPSTVTGPVTHTVESRPGCCCGCMRCSWLSKDTGALGFPATRPAHH